MHFMGILRRNLILIGCGIHYKEKYHVVLEGLGVCIHLLIDLKARQREIQAFFRDKVLKPKKMLFLEESFRNFITPKQIDCLVAEKANLHDVDGIILCTEPKVRKPYAIWAAQKGFQFSWINLLVLSLKSKVWILF